MFLAKHLVCICVLGLISKVTAAHSITAAVFAQEVIIEVKGTIDADDYLCWSPVSARIKLVVPAPNPVAINLRSTSQAGGGAVWFQADNGIRPTPATFSPTDELSLSLPGDGTWVNFWIAGHRASSGGKDINVVASDGAGNELGTLPVMVRVRKDAETLNPIEIDQFLRALAEVHDLRNGALDSQYYKYVQAHAEAPTLEIHGADSGRPLFLVWHRAFLLSLERELQAMYPQVALPYWRFDRPAPKIFTPEFMGSVQGGVNEPGGFLVVFSQTNPLYGWRMNDGLSSLVRMKDAAEASPIPENRLELIFQVSSNNEYEDINRAIQLRYHNGAHRHIRGWLFKASSPSDPLFFLLHANVDRAWTHWQAQFDRFNPTDPPAYSAQGSFVAASGSDRFRKGSYAQDTMWPWNGAGGDQGTADPMDDWPVLSYPMPTAPGAEGPTLPPRPADMIDYLDVAGQGVPHGICYDDIDYYGQPIGAGN